VNTVHRRLLALLPLLLATSLSAAEPLPLKLRYQQESSPGSNRFHRLQKDESWQADETAIIVCDAWDLHHCLNAVRRLEEFAPRLNQLLVEARRRGVTIVHAPSDCMDAYADHPARRRAMQAPKSDTLPTDITSWCSKIPAEEQAVYPIDQSDGGEDDDPREHAEWAAKLKAMGRKPGTPWKKQTDLIAIDPQRDFVSDRGDEIWNVLQSRGIKNVILTGVHTNMCVLGRPFGLRQMARNGKRVVLIRDLTDCMYNPRRWPYVNHFTGNDLIVSYIERHICPTITSDQILGDQAFRYKSDTRPHLAIVVAEDEYQTERSLPEFAAGQLGQDFRVSFVFGSDKQRNEIPGLEVLDEADLLLLSVRRRVLPRESMDIVRRCVAAGKPVLGIRTASHAFALRNEPPPEGYADWPELDAAVLGGNYQGHHGNQLESTISVAEGQAQHPIVAGIVTEPFVQGGSLYRNRPLAKGATELLTGKAEGFPAEPVAWTFQRADGGRSFYTSLGHIKDFENPTFVRMLHAAILWGAGLNPAEASAPRLDTSTYRGSWSPMAVPGSWKQMAGEALRDHDGAVWYRCAIRVPSAWRGDRALQLHLPPIQDVGVWWNGQHLSGEAKSPATSTTGSTDALRNVSDDKSASGSSDTASISVPAEWIEADDANLLVLRIPAGGPDGLTAAPILVAGDRRFALKGRWQFRAGDDPSWSNLPLPAKFGAPADIYFEAQ
jgi:nicotinamidase-related amidase/type 1 glutamine amidotransferase